MPELATATGERRAESQLVLPDLALSRKWPGWIRRPLPRSTQLYPTDQRRYSEHPSYASTRAAAGRDTLCNPLQCTSAARTKFKPSTSSVGERSAAHRTPLAVSLPLDALSRRGDYGRVERHRHRTMGHRGQALRRAVLPTDGRQGARQSACLLPRLRANYGTTDRGAAVDAKAQGFSRCRRTSRRSSTNLGTCPIFKTHADKMRDAIDTVRHYRDAVGNDVDFCALETSTVVATPSEASCWRAASNSTIPSSTKTPILPDSFDAMALVAQNIHIPTSPPASACTPIYELPERCWRGARCSTSVPDVCLAGGILTHSKKIAALAEAHHVGVVPHNPLSPVSTAACLQLAACIPNFAHPGVPHRRTRTAQERHRARRHSKLKTASSSSPTRPVSASSWRTMRLGTLSVQTAQDRHTAAPRRIGRGSVR